MLCYKLQYRCYFIYDLKDIKFIDDLCKYIYFNHYVDKNGFLLNYSNILSLGYFKIDRIYHN